MIISPFSASNGVAGLCTEAFPFPAPSVTVNEDMIKIENGNLHVDVPLPTPSTDKEGILELLSHSKSKQVLNNASLTCACYRSSVILLSPACHSNFLRWHLTSQFVKLLLSQRFFFFFFFIAWLEARSVTIMTTSLLQHTSIYPPPSPSSTLQNFLNVFFIEIINFIMEILNRTQNIHADEYFFPFFVIKS